MLSPAKPLDRVQPNLPSDLHTVRLSHYISGPCKTVDKGDINEAILKKSFAVTLLIIFQVGR